jgi:hypothetical protein
MGSRSLPASKSKPASGLGRPHSSLVATNLLDVAGYNTVTSAPLNSTPMHH